MTDSITFDMYKLNGTTNLTETSETEKTDETKSDSKKTSAITIPIGQSSEEKTGDVSEFLDKDSMEKIEKKNIKFPRFRVTKTEVEKAKQFLLTSAKELGLDEDGINSLSREQKTLYIALALAYEKGQITKEEFAEMAKKHGEKSISEYIAKKFPDGTVNIEPERLKALEQQFEHIQKFNTICYKKCAAHIFGKNQEETKRLRGEYWISVAKQTESDQQRLTEVSANSLPKQCSTNAANSILDASMTYAKTAKETLVSTAEKSGCSKEDIEKLKSTIDTTCIKIQKNHTTFKEKFWNSPRGQAIISYSRYLFSSFVSQKKECEEKEAEALEKQEEAVAAEKEAEKAQEQANKMKEAQDAALSKYKVDDLSDDKQAEIYRHISPRAALQKKWADADLKKAQDVQYDAESAKRLADAFLRYAQIQLSYIKARMAAFRTAMSMLR